MELSTIVDGSPVVEEEDHGQIDVAPTEIGPRHIAWRFDRGPLIAGRLN